MSRSEIRRKYIDADGNEHVCTLRRDDGKAFADFDGLPADPFMEALISACDKMSAERGLKRKDAEDDD